MSAQDVARRELAAGLELLIPSSRIFYDVYDLMVPVADGTADQVSGASAGVCSLRPPAPPHPRLCTAPSPCTRGRCSSPSRSTPPRTSRRPSPTCLPCIGASPGPTSCCRRAASRLAHSLRKVAAPSHADRMRARRDCVPCAAMARPLVSRCSSAPRERTGLPGAWRAPACTRPEAERARPSVGSRRMSRMHGTGSVPPSAGRRASGSARRVISNNNHRHIDGEYKRIADIA